MLYRIHSNIIATDGIQSKLQLPPPRQRRRHNQQFSVAATLQNHPRAKLEAPLCRYTGVTRKVPFMLRPQDKKGAPLCRYTGVTRKVPFKLRPKDRKKVSKGYWKSVEPRGETKTEETEEYNLRRQSSYSPSENWDWLRVTWSFPLMLRNGLETTVFWGLN